MAFNHHRDRLSCQRMFHLHKSHLDHPQLSCAGLLQVVPERLLPFSALSIFFCGIIVQFIIFGLTTPLFLLGNMGWGGGGGRGGGSSWPRSNFPQHQLSLAEYPKVSRFFHQLQVSGNIFLIDSQ